ncbi:hypothetical protein [Streptomyces sp. NBC_00996]|uniref:hypothetical protein n=1 Tax=Streptomyces sp. NBC_00996 TaxID=2903710 RepID=UPI00386DC862|nr:hypothetical protein OG390_12590 [Streptomyces sp. NBC_00996]
MARRSRGTSAVVAGCSAALLLGMAAASPRADAGPSPTSPAAVQRAAAAPATPGTSSATLACCPSTRTPGRRSAPVARRSPPIARVHKAYADRLPGSAYARSGEVGGYGSESPGTGRPGAPEGPGPAVVIASAIAGVGALVALALSASRALRRCRR